VQVVAAVIERDGLILIGQRKSSGRHPLKWEFPGGKVEPGEDPHTALARELREELGIEAEIGQQVDAYDVRYSSGPPLRLVFLRVNAFSGDPRNLDFEQILWVDPSHLADYDFLEGDLPFIARWSASSHA
jgi:mutator protein MutT